MASSSNNPTVNASRLGASICAIVSPFRENGQIDAVAYQKLLALHVSAGTDALVVGGSTGESASLEEAEFVELLDLSIAKAGKAMPIIAGCGAASTHKALKLMHIAADRGAKAALVVTPYYVRPTQEGLFRHYSALADQGKLPVILYNVPTRTGCDLLPQTVARLSEHPNIIAIKEARSEAERMAELLALQTDTFAVMSGDDPTALRAMRQGAKGIISVAANVVPRTFKALTQAALHKQDEQATALDNQLQSIYRVLGIEPNPIPAKWLLHRLGIIGPALRLPLVELSPPYRAEAEEAANLIRKLEKDGFPAAATQAA